MRVYEYSRASAEHPDRCEDALLAFVPNGDRTRYAPVFAVIDGLGGHQHNIADGSAITGYDAAQMIRTVLIEDLEHLPAEINGAPDGEAEQRITAALLRANDRVFHELNCGGTFAARERVGAVVTVCVLCENGQRIVALQVGDSRGYLFSGGDLIQLCMDEDNIEHLVRQKRISEADAARLSTVLNGYDGVHTPSAEGSLTVDGQQYPLYISWRWFLDGNTALNIPAANVVINAVGLTAELPAPEHSRIETEKGDLLCLCSDGLYKNLTDSEIAAVLRGQAEPARWLGEAAYNRSQDASNQRRTPDDISMLVVEL